TADVLLPGHVDLPAEGGHLIAVIRWDRAAHGLSQAGGVHEQVEGRNQEQKQLYERFEGVDEQVARHFAAAAQHTRTGEQLVDEARYINPQRLRPHARDEGGLDLWNVFDEQVPLLDDARIEEAGPCK